MLTTIIPSILPYPRYILLILLLGNIILFSGFRGKIYIGQSIQFNIIVFFWFIYFILTVVDTLTISSFKESHLLSLSGQLIIIPLLFICLNNYTNTYGFNSVVRIYVLVCFVISVFGITAWLLITFTVVDPTSWFVNIGEITAGRVPKREDGFHVAPFYLGLVQYKESADFTLLNFPMRLFRLSGFSAESQQAAFFMAPSIFLVRPAFKSRPKYKSIIFFTIALFLILTFSLTLYLVMPVLMLIYYLSKFKLVHLTLLVTIIVLIISFYMDLFGIKANQTDLVSNKLAEGIVTYDRSRLLLGIFRTDTLLSPGFSSEGYAGAIYYFSFYSIWLLMFILSLNLIFSKMKYKEVGFSVLYISIHLLKGAGPTIMNWPFFFFIIWLLGYVYKINNVRRDTKYSSKFKMV
jgi:hypothetical protein